MATPNFSNITEAKVSWVRPTNFIDKKKAFAGYEKAKKDNYAWDFVQFVTNLEKKWLVVEESTQIKNTKAQQLYQEQKRVDAQKAIWRKIPITEASGSEIRNDLVNDLWEWAKTFLAPSAWMLQWLADIGQWAVWKPIEFLTKKMLWAFWYSDESLESITTQSDISKWLNQEWAKIGREVWKFAWSMALTPWWSVWGIAKWLKWIPYMQEVAKRIAIGVWEWLAGNAAYNVATTDTLWTPVNLWVWAAIWGAFRWLPIIGNAMLPLRNKLASKLQLSWLMTRTKLENLQNILKQWGAEELAQWTPEDVAEWMFQRWLEGNKKVIMTKLDDIIDASTDMLDRKLSKVQWLHDTGTLDDILGMLQKEYDGAISGEFKKKYKTVEWMIAKKSKEWGLTIKEINEVKRMVYKDLNPFTASGKVKASAEDVAFANREIKNFIEDVAQRSGVTEDWLTIKLLNNEFAMADWLKKAIAQRDALDSVSWVLNFISHSGWPLAIGWTLWSQVWPFDRKTTLWQIGNIVVWALAGRAATSTAVTTKVAWWLRSIPKEQQAKILTIMKKWVKATDAEKNTLLQSFSKLDVDLIDDTDLNFSDEAAAISNSSIRNMVDNSTPQVAEQLDNVASPTADLWSILQKATDEELKANWFTATMIKQFRKKNPLTKVWTTESAIQDIAGKADEVLQEATPMSKVDDALPTAWKMEQKAKSLDNLDHTKSIEKAKAEWKTVEEFVKSKAPKYMREYVDKDWVITEYRYYDHSYPKTFIAKKDIWEWIKKWDIVALVKEKNEINAIHSPYTKWWFKYTIERKVSLDDFTNVIEQTPPTPTPAVWKPLQKIDNTLLSEARKYKSADEFVDKKWGLQGLLASPEDTSFFYNKNTYGGVRFPSSKKEVLDTIESMKKRGLSDDEISEKIVSKYGVVKKDLVLDDVVKDKVLSSKRLEDLWMPKKLYRWVSKEWPTGTAKYWNWIYSSPNKSNAKNYGDVSELRNDIAMPKSPIQFKNAMEFENRIDYDVLKSLWLKTKKEFYQKYPDIWEFVKQLGADGITIWPLDDMYVVKFTDKTGIWESPLWEAQLRKIREEANKTK